MTLTLTTRRPATAGLRPAVPRALQLALVTVLVVVWAVLLAPANLGGPATYALVEGRSMEPMLHSGDVAVARASSSYSIGDLVVVRVGSGGTTSLVIHRLVAGSSTAGWTTQGDNNPRPDAWTVTDAQIAGRYWFDVPALGSALGWVTRHPVPFGALLALVAVLQYLPWRRRRLDPVLTDALTRATHESARVGRSRIEYADLAISSGAAALSLGLVTFLYSRHQLATTSGVIALGALVAASTIATVLVYRLYDGRGIPEPRHSLYALSGRLDLVSELPALDDAAVDVASAVALRSLAEHYRLPVLHHVDLDARTHTFLLVTAGHGSYRWSAPMQEEPPKEI